MKLGRRWGIVWVSAVLIGVNFLLGGCGESLKTTESSRQAASDSAAIGALKVENSQLKRSNGQLEQDKKALNGKVADLTSRLGQSSQQWQDLQDLQQRTHSLDSELTVQRQVNSDLDAKLAQMGTQPGEATVTGAEEFKEKYQQGLRLFDSRKYSEAAAIFKELSLSNADPTLASNTHYWLGECSYARQKYRDAIAEFERTLSYRKSFKTGAAYLMLGMSYLRLGEKTKARAAWEKLINKDPKSKYSMRAKEFINQL